MNRVVPVLLLHDGLLVKTQQFKNPRYVGDPVNAVRIFNEKEVDELVILDMDPSRGESRVRMSLLEDIASEAFMPIAYGGGIRSVEQAKDVISLGVEKVVINSAAVTNPKLIAEAASVLGSQAIVAGVDFTRSRRGKQRTAIEGGRSRLSSSPLEAAQRAIAQGAGEIFLQSIDRDGRMHGFDIQTIREVSASCSVPVVACGGAGSIDHLCDALKAGASAVAAGSMFIFHGKHRAVLLTYPSRDAINELSSLADGSPND